MARNTDARHSRRALLTAATGAAAATVMGALARPLPALAQPGDDGSAINVASTFLDVRDTTYLSNQANRNTVFSAVSSSANGDGTGTALSGTSGSGFGVWGHSDRHTGVYGESLGGIGVHGVSTSSSGVFGVSTSSSGVFGSSDSSNGVFGGSHASDRAAILAQSAGGSTGVQGFSGTESSAPPLPPAKTGVFGSANQDAHSVGVSGSSKSGTGVSGFSTSGTGVTGASTSGAAVRGTSSSGRGAVFTSPLAQLRLVPATASTHPSSGVAGDLFVDKSHRLWFCKGGTNWKQII